jgi:hypothetical protein
MTFVRLSTVVVAALVGGFLVVVTSSGTLADAIRSDPPKETLPNRDRADESEARARCGAVCHAYPPPDVLPRAAWRDAIARMMLIAENQPSPEGPPGVAGRMVPLTPDMQRLLRFYEAEAPAALPAPTPWPNADSRMFAVRAFVPSAAPPDPAMSHVRFLDLDGDGRLEIVGADMRHGLLLSGRPSDSHRRLEVVATVPHPAHFEPLDLNGAGIKGLVVADLGRFFPGDHTDGSVVWLRRTERGELAPLAVSGLPRVADVRPADLNADGKVDLIVSAFGWRKVGNVRVLENRMSSAERSEPTFIAHQVDARAGAVSAVPADLNGDGHLDIVALISQQHETVVAYINTGVGFTFRPEVIYAAPHPNWGSSGLELVDLDKDGDQDVLLAHGDTFDDAIVKPYHGIQWLENTGKYPYVPHTLADLPGVFAAKAGDLDGDGDLDIVACAFLAGGSNLDESEMPSLVWLEQTKPGTFERRTLERKPPRHATLDLADMDGDGDLDLLVGSFATTNTNMPWIELWENRRK